MPTRVYSEENVRKRKILDEKPTRKYTKAIKEEIKQEPFELSDNDDIDGDDVMDIEEADGTLPKKGKFAAKKRIIKSKKVKKLLGKMEKDQKDKPKTKRKKKLQVQPQTPVSGENLLTPANVNSTNKPATVPTDTSKPTKKIAKVKEKKIKPKSGKVLKKNEKVQQQENNSDSDSSPEESDAYETCGVLNCTRPSGELP